MVFIKTASGLYVSANDESGYLCLTSKPKTFFFPKHGNHAQYPSAVNLHVLMVSPKMYMGYKCISRDPFAAEPVDVVYSTTSKDQYFIKYCVRDEYWTVGEENKVTTTKDISNATLFVNERYLMQGIDFDTHLHEMEVKGFTVFPNLIPSAEVHLLKERLELPQQADVQIRVGNLLKKDPIYSAALLHPVLLQFVRLYLHPHAKCATWSSNTLYPRQGIQENEGYGWHVDYPYHDINAPWLADPLSAQVLWCLDDFTAENGGTMIVPGSHKALTFPSPSNMASKKFDALKAPKGSVVIAHGSWWHAQGINRTSETRSCMLGTFSLPWIKPKNDQSDQSIRVQCDSLPADHPYKKQLEGIV
eukprot:gene13917-19847_t